MADFTGKATPLNVLTPIPPWLWFYRTWVLPFVFRVWVPLFSRGPGPLDKLAFIHFARWVLIPHDRFPHLAPEQPREDLHYDYWLFCSNFNGTWGQYLDAFSDVISDKVNWLWLRSVKYPKARPLTPFLKYAAYNEIDTDYYYNAYPGASTRDILSALELHAQLQTFAAATVDLPPDDFQREYDAFLTRVQGCLGTTGLPQRGKTPDDHAKAEPREGALESHLSVPVAPNGADGNRK
jgi:hypothetical protein